MNIALWIVQALLAIIFLLAGILKLTQSKQKLYNSMQWVEGFSGDQVRLIGVLEILGALGLILPGLLNLQPWLTSLAAIGLALIMVGAIFTHLRRREFPNIAINIVILALVLIVV